MAAFHVVKTPAMGLATNRGPVNRPAWVHQSARRSLGHCGRKERPQPLLRGYRGPVSRLWLSVVGSAKTTPPPQSSPVQRLSIREWLKRSARLCMNSIGLRSRRTSIRLRSRSSRARSAIAARRVCRSIALMRMAFSTAGQSFSCSGVSCSAALTSPLFVVHGPVALPPFHCSAAM